MREPRTCEFAETLRPSNPETLTLPRTARPSDRFLEIELRDPREDALRLGVSLPLPLRHPRNPGRGNDLAGRLSINGNLCGLAASELRAIGLHQFEKVSFVLCQGCLPPMRLTAVE